MGIEQAIGKALDYAERHKGLNEDNTRALLIDPMLAALGWNVEDVSEVERGYAVYDGTRLDYALKAQKPVLFVEAKALGISLDDPKHISQTVNYANNEGVRWCVLTNALVYRVYKTNEPVRMDRKLLYEVDLREAKEGGAFAPVIEELSRLRRDRVVAGDLDRWGEAVFIDNKVRQAVADLYAKPPDRFLRLLRDAVGDKSLTSSQIRQSLTRVMVSPGQPVGQPATKAEGGADAAGKGKRAGPLPTKKAKPWTLEHHSKGKPQQIVSLFEQLNQRLLAFGSDVSRTFAQDYINYTRKKSFATVELKRSKITMFVSIPYGEVSKLDATLTRDVAKIGHFGMGDTEVTLTDQGHIDYAASVARQGYDRQA